MGECNNHFFASLAMPIPARATAPAVMAPPTSKAPPSTPRPRRPSAKENNWFTDHIPTDTIMTR